MGLGLSRRKDESLDDFLVRFRKIVASLSVEDGELLAGMLRNKNFSFEEIVASFECIYEYQTKKKEGKENEQGRPEAKGGGEQ